MKGIGSGTVFPLVAASFLLLLLSLGYSACFRCPCCHITFPLPPQHVPFDLPAYVYMYNFSCEHRQDEQAITCISWLTGPSAVTVSEVHFIWAFVLCVWGPFCEVRDSASLMRRFQGSTFFWKLYGFCISCSWDCLGLETPLTVATSPRLWVHRGGGMLGGFLCVTRPLVAVFAWTQSSDLNQLSICPPFSFPHDCYVRIVSFLVHYSYCHSFLSFFPLLLLYSRSDMLGWVLWPHILLHASSHEVFGKEVNCQRPSSLLIAFGNWGSVLSFDLWLTWEPLSPNTGWNAPSWMSVCLSMCSFTVPSFLHYFGGN